jgi:hypothetical protein
MEYVANLQQSEQPKEMEPQKREALKERIRKHVILTLGKPLDLLKVQVRPIWTDRFRVNVVVGANAGSTKITNSYFIVVDANGSVISSTPKITKQY